MATSLPTGRRHRVSVGLACAAAVAFVAVVIGAIVVGGSDDPVDRGGPAALVVTSAADTGPGSLRDVLRRANRSDVRGLVRITFGLAETDRRIRPRSALPVVTASVSIDGCDGRHPIVEVDGQATEPGTPGIVLRGARSSIRCLSVHGFDNRGADESADVVVDADDVTVRSSHIGVGPDGSAGGGRVDEQGMVVLTGRGGAVIGGAGDGDGNLFASTGENYGLVIAGHAAEILGNRVNVGIDGATDLGSILGVAVSGDRNVFGRPGAGNLVAGAQIINLLVTGNDNRVQANFVGTDARGEVNPSITNGVDPTVDNESVRRGVGIAVTGGSGNLVGGPAAGEGNRIAGVGGIGIAVEELEYPARSLRLVPRLNALLGNSVDSVSTVVYPGGGPTNQVIDFVTGVGADDDYFPDSYRRIGPDPRDDAVPGDGPNDGIGRPVLLAATASGTRLTVRVDVPTGGAATTMRVELFAGRSLGPDGAGTAVERVGVVEAAPAGAVGQFDVGVPPGLVGQWLTATVTPVATAAATGFGGTSELSGPVMVSG